MARAGKFPGIAARDIQIEILMNDPIAELAEQATHLNQVFRRTVPGSRAVRGGHQFISRKIMANTASRNMMAKMACTTAAVTRLPRLSTSPPTAIP